MRGAKYQRVDEAVAQPHSQGWTYLTLPDSAGTQELQEAVLAQEGLPASTPLHVLMPEPISAYQRLDHMEELLPGLLLVKIIAPKSRGMLFLLCQCMWMQILPIFKESDQR